MDGEQILDRLRRADERTLAFNAVGLGGRLEPAESAMFLSDLLAHMILFDPVPEAVRRTFERVRSLFQYGLFEYEFFSGAYDLGHLALEGALRARFIDYYRGTIPIIRSGSVDVLVVESFADYFDALQTARTRGERLRLGEPSEDALPRGYADLYGWARARGLLIGQRNVGIFGAISELRNYVAHPERYRLDTPPSVFRFLRDAAEIINRLWGQDTDGGRLFPGPVARRPRAAALSPDGKASVSFPSLASLRDGDVGRDWRYAVFLAPETQELTGWDWGDAGGLRFVWTAGFEMTQYPTELLWGPGSVDDLFAVIDEFDDRAPTDEAPFLDREFYVRVSGEARPEFPRIAPAVAALDVNDRSAVWYVVRADFPMDAWAHVRDLDQQPADGGERWTNASVVKRLVGDARARRQAGTMR